MKGKKCVTKLMAGVALAFVVAALPAITSITTGAVSAAPKISAAPQVAMVAESPPPNAAAQLALIPPQYRAYYTNWWYLSEIQKNPYANWKAFKTPVQWCYASTYQGNIWRQDATIEINQIVAEQAKAGFADPNLIFTNSNLNTDLTIAQINDDVRAGCAVILTIAPSTTALCAAAKNAFNHHVMVVSVESATFCPDTMNISFNQYLVAYTTATWLAQRVKSGNIFATYGIVGSGESVARQAGLLDALKKYPNVKLAGEVTGAFTATVAKANTLEWITTHPGVKIKGLWDSGISGVAMAEAFAESGQNIKLVTGYAGESQALAYWHQNHLQSISVSQGPFTAMNEAMIIVTRMLKGQQPVVNTILYPRPWITNANLNVYYKPSMTLDSSSFSDPPNDLAVPNSYFDAYFKK